MQRKYTKLFWSLVITAEIIGCSTPVKPQNAQIFFNPQTQDYAYCNEESCPQPTVFTLDTEEELPPIFIAPVKGSRTEKVVVNFPFNKAYLTKNDLVKLSKRLEIVKSDPDVRVAIIGYTDNVEAITSKSHANQKLALERAMVVKNLLIKKYGISANKITVQGKPLCCYVATNKNKHGRYENRRAEIEVVINPK